MDHTDLLFKRLGKIFFFTSVYWFSSLLDRHTIIKLAVAKRLWTLNEHLREMTGSSMSLAF